MKHEIGTRTEIYDETSNSAIKVTSLYKSFKLPTEQAFGLKQAFFNRIRGVKGYTEQKVPLQGRTVYKPVHRRRRVLMRYNKTQHHT